MSALIRASREGLIPARPALVVSTSPDAPALRRAEELGVASRVVQAGSGDALDQALVEVFRQAEVSAVCLAGYMRLLGPLFLRAFPGRVLNIHPSLLPLYGGRGYYGRHVHEAVLQSGARFSGATVHFLDGDYDQGPIILQDVAPVLDDDSPESLAARVLEVEHRIYPEAVSLLFQNRLRIEGLRVRHLPPG